MQRFRRVLGFASIVGLSAVALATSGGAGGSPSNARASEASPINLTGRWSGNDGSTYYIRRVGRAAVWWVGFNGEATAQNIGQRYTNVFRGTITGGTIHGTWYELPRGEGPLDSGEIWLKLEGGDPPSLRITRERRGTMLTTRRWDKES
jgi:hypothetical protein